MKVFRWNAVNISRRLTICLAAFRLFLGLCFVSALGLSQIASAQTVQIGEVGSIAGNVGDWQTVTLSGSYTDPIVVAQARNYSGGDVGRARVQNVTGTSFQVAFKDFDFEAQGHAAQVISYFVVERGAWILPNGQKIEAGDVSVTCCDVDSSTSFAQVFDTTPALIATPNTNRAQSVYFRAKDLTASSFNMRFTDADATGDPETINWIAMETGGDGTYGIAKLLTTTQGAIQTWTYGQTLASTAHVFYTTRSYLDATPMTNRLNAPPSTTSSTFFQQRNTNFTYHAAAEDVSAVAMPEGTLTGTSPLVVINTNDSGGGSLRDAIEFANANTAEDTISFDIDGTGPHVISLTTSLPAIDDNDVSLDGTTQTSTVCGNLWSGEAHTLQIEIDAAGQDHGLRIDSDNVEVRGLSITGAGTSGINTGLAADNGIFQCNYFGLRPDGTSDGNGEGLRFNGDGHLIGGPNATDGNIISGNTSRNIFFSQTYNANHTVQGNFIGPFPGGMTAPSGQGSGILNHHADNTLYDNNLISGNSGFGYASGPGTSPVNNTFTNNYFGVTRTGDGALANSNDNIHFNTSSASAADGLTIGTPGNGNVISNATRGIQIVRASNLIIQGNLIGTGADGVTDMGSSAEGINLGSDTDGAIIGGINAGEGNVIAYANEEQIQIAGNDISILGNTLFGDDGMITITTNATDELNLPTVEHVAADGSTTIVPILSADLPAGDYRVELFKVGTETASNRGDAREYFGSFDITHGGTGVEYFSAAPTGLIAITAGDIMTATVTEKLTATTFASTSELANNGTATNFLVVLNTNDSGAGSLRDAITYANNQSNIDLIEFDVSGAADTVHTISVTSALPTITDANVTIDGTSQGDATCGNLWAGTPHTLRIQIDGGGGSFDMFTTNGANTEFRGMSITDGNRGILFDSGSTNGVVQCSHIGLTPDGTADGHSDRGVRVTGSNTLIGGLTAGQGNVISGNTIGGIASSSGASAMMVRGNFIGTDPTGLLARPNENRPIDNATGAATWSDITKNLISGNNSVSGDIGGIKIDSDDTVTGSSGDVLIQGNYIGVDRTGNTALSNGGDSIMITGPSSGFTIGGTDPEDRNILAWSEIDLRIDDLTILGNYIGVGADGVTRMNPGGQNLHLRGSSNVTVGDGTASGRNVIAGGTGTGIRLHNMSNTTVDGNYLGVGADGTTNIAGTGSGISITTGGSNILITNNTITNFSTEGIDSSAGSAAIISNSIYNNDGAGIDLNGDGVTDNDSGGGDADTGPNDLLNFPLINQISAGGTTSVGYSVELDVPANTEGYRIEFFKNSSPDTTNGEGEIFLGFVDTGDHPGGAISYDGTFTANEAVAVGDSISATTTRKTATGYDITSEFAVNVLAVSPLVVTNTNDSGAGSLRAAIDYANANPTEDDITFKIPGSSSDVHTITLVSALPTITDAGIVLDGTTQGNAVCGDLWAGEGHTLRIDVEWPTQPPILATT